ncbi:hypothetical protein CW751_13255 [Brumimicrobium salinarum]|uniref:Uncharacterized protein n=1 Tax=Brumimicrobium salinarum TaxID=2058658 RepID=A0A2I0QZR7_9FLAO|nr:hypothetical protein [Brumimicrobium salinarum]PKR79793.1 hypothetical protein CW751_13255 [Brumimicrobium salinarum]
MKKLTTNLLLTIFFFGTLTTSIIAQNETAGTYYLFAKVDDVLIDFKKVETTSDRKVLTGYSDRAPFPKDLLDTVREKTNQLISKKLGVEANMLYVQDKKGRDRVTQGMSIFPGMPLMNFKPAMRADDRKYYVKIYMDISPRSTFKSDLNKNRSKQKPKVDIRVTIKDRYGKKYFKNREVLKDFDALQSETRVTNRVKITNSEVLSPEEIVEMYVLGLEAVLFEK